MESFADIHRICNELFRAVNTTISVFIFPLFMAKIVFSNITGEGVKAIATLKGAVVYFCLAAAFPIFLDILFSIPESFIPNGKDTINGFFNPQTSPFEETFIPGILDKVFEVILALCYWIAFYLHVLFMIVMSSMAPIIFLCGAILGLGLGIEIFLGLMIVASCWPIIWFGFDSVHNALASANTDEFGARCLELLLTILKGLAPVSFASLAVKSPAGRAVSSAAKGVISTGASVLSGRPAFAGQAARFLNFGSNQKPFQATYNRTKQTSTNTVVQSSSKDRLKNNKGSIAKGKGSENTRPGNSKT